MKYSRRMFLERVDLDTRLAKLMTCFRVKMLRWYLQHNDAEWYEMLSVNPEYIEWCEKTFRQ